MNPSTATRQSLEKGEVDRRYKGVVLGLVYSRGGTSLVLEEW